jgi:hypothetical protein
VTDRPEIPRESNVSHRFGAITEQGWVRESSHATNGNEPALPVRQYVTYSPWEHDDPETRRAFLDSQDPFITALVEKHRPTYYPDAWASPGSQRVFTQCPACDGNRVTSARLTDGPLKGCDLWQEAISRGLVADQTPKEIVR